MVLSVVQFDYILRCDVIVHQGCMFADIGLHDNPYTIRLPKRKKMNIEVCKFRFDELRTKFTSCSPDQREKMLITKLVNTLHALGSSI